MAEVPYGERDVVVHWFHHPGSEKKNDTTPFIGMYVADPDGPIPLELDADGEKWVPASFRPRIRTYTLGGNPNTNESASLAMYHTDHPGSGFVPWVFAVPADVSEVIVDISTYLYEDDDGEEERRELHSFRSISFVQVEPPASKCAIRWLGTGWWRSLFARNTQHYSTVLGSPDCHPSEWARWWGVRATYREEGSE